MPKLPSKRVYHTALETALEWSLVRIKYGHPIELNVLIFIVGWIMTFLRYALYLKEIQVMFTYSAQSMFLETLSVGLAMIVNISSCVRSSWGRGAAVIC